MNRMKLASLVSATLLLIYSGAAQANAGGESQSQPGGFSNIEIPLPDFALDPIENYPGHQVLLIVNPASLCGDESQDDLETKPTDPSVSAFFHSLEMVSNDPSGPGTESDEASGSGCGRNESSGLLVFSRVPGNGHDDPPAHVYLASLPEKTTGSVDWQFQRYMVDRSGSVVTRSGPGAGMLDADLVGEIESLLADPLRDSSNVRLAR
jgi:glutathione peroxidase